ncbi:MAG: hypothetical protein CM15mV20_1650 [uncultured marine virus]|nr:MAG: hypothetical protein CM15mV20_1650 [uncultured marine virus]
MFTTQRTERMVTYNTFINIMKESYKFNGSQRNCRSLPVSIRKEKT